MALEDSEVVAISRGTFLRMIRQNPEVSVKMMQRLAQRNRELTSRVESDSSRGVRVRPQPATVSLVSVISGKKFMILSHGALVGRFDPNTGIHPDIDLTPVDGQRSISRRHAKIYRRGNRFFFAEEIGTMNGTFVNNVRIETGVPMEIKQGDEVRFGVIETTFQMA